MRRAVASASAIPSWDTDDRWACWTDGAAVGGTWATLIWDSRGTGTGTFTITAVDLAVTPSSGPASTSVSVSGGGFKSGETVKVNDKTGLASPTKALICRAAASSTGTVNCAGAVPTTSTGATGLHVVQAVGSTSGHKTRGTFTLL